MGVTIESKNCSIDMGCGGFLRLRRTVSRLCPVEVATHYMYFHDNLTLFLSDKKLCDAYDRRTEQLYEEYRDKCGKVIGFLYAPDTGAKMDYETAEQLLEVIGEYDDDQIYGYAGWGPHAARFADFKELLRDSAKTKSSFEWD